MLPAGQAAALSDRQAAAIQTVIIYLKDQPFAVEAQRQQAAHQAAAEALVARVAAASAPLAAGEAPRTETQEEALAQASLDLSGPAQAERQQALASLEALHHEQRQAVFDAAQPAVAASQAPVAALIAAQGGTVTARITVVNALAARVPPAVVSVLQRHPEVAAVVSEEPAHSALETSPISLGAPALWQAGYTGSALDLAVVDTGIDATHPAFVGQSFLAERFLSTAGGAAGGDPLADDVNGHGTHVAGIAGSTQPGQLGVAYGLDKLLNAKAGYDPDGLPGGGSSMYPSDSMDAVEWALFEAADPAEVVNLSFSMCHNGADDTAWARFFDAVVGASGATVAVAAGNTSSGCGTVTSPSIAYNVLSIANVNDFNTTNRTDDTHNATSLPGPTALGRRKPDLAAPGTAINSANAAWEGAAPDFVSLTGTSMAAPHAAGAALLLRHAGVTDPRALRALLINSAEDKGAAGWDPLYGWGYIDLAHAFAHRADTRLGTLTPGSAYQLFKGPALAGDTATLTWHRHVTYPCATASCSETVPVSNLDLALYSAATNSLLSASTTPTDTVEQVRAPAASALNVLRVSMLSLGAGLSQETFALATEEGYTPAVGPVLTDGSASHFVLPGYAWPVTLRLVNTGDLPAHSVTLTVTVPAGLSLPAGPQVFNVGHLAAGAVYTVPFTVTLEQNAPRYFSLAATGTGYGTHLALNDTAGVLPAASVRWLPLVGRP